MRYEELLDEARPLPGAHHFLVAIKAAGLRVSLASSAKPEDMERFSTCSTRETCRTI